MVRETHQLKFDEAEIESSIPVRFRRAAREYANRPALSDHQTILTYEQLELAAGAIARRIVDRDDDFQPVVSLFGHEIMSIVAILGIITTGRPYVALDTIYPERRLKEMLGELGSGLVLTGSRNSEWQRILRIDPTRILQIDIKDWLAPAEVPAVDCGPDSLAAIFYTSGSTGKPKGVKQNHRNILHRAYVETNDYRIDPDDRIALVHPCSSSASTTDIFNALLNGGRLCLYDLHRGGLQLLAGWILDQEITMLHLPVAVFREFLEGCESGDHFPRVRQVVASGRLYWKDVEKFWRYFSPPCTLIQRLASSEAGMMTRLVIDAETPILEGAVPVGRPAHGKEVLVVDQAGRPSASGETGRIVVRSRFLSPGYWQLPQLTASKFQVDPGSGMRMHFTGDLGRYRNDGCLEWQGREDDVVKIRGHRVPLSAIETELRELDGIRDCIVTTHQPASGDVRLVAYVVPTLQSELDPETIRDTLATRLPRHMWPSSIIPLDSLPLTANGKIDTSRLPAPEPLRPELDSDYVAPRSDIEREIAAIWKAILEVEYIGIHNDFFSLGGDSLRAMRICSRVARRFNIETPVALLDKPTVAAMAHAIGAAISPNDSDQADESSPPP